MWTRWRVLLAWMLMVAVPLQGLAAGSMLFCAAATHEVAASASPLKQHDHSTHSHHSGDAVEKAAPAAQVTIADVQHQCSVCAACCHSVAISELPAMSQAVPAPQADLADPFVLIVSHPSPLPDKPPRA